MKLTKEPCGVFIEITTSDIIKMSRNIEYESTEEYYSMFNAVTKDFVEWEDYVRHDLIMMLVKKHKNKKISTKIESLLEE